MASALHDDIDPKSASKIFSLFPDTKSVFRTTTVLFNIRPISYFAFIYMLIMVLICETLTLSTYTVELGSRRLTAGK